MNSNLSKKHGLTLIYLWAKSACRKQLLSTGLILYEICQFNVDSLAIYFGSSRHIVEIDESLISRRKNNTARVIPERWVFGIYDRTTKLSYFVEVMLLVVVGTPKDF
ncbi:hypothetical protein RF11_03515 [Thelohanellus kitauei]|uniref:ISXO2-like transposase domain-containing protein n=1 Tax=Thelohanellus kitauei TaxID=669202 RepID=A0A0C2NHQ8_THEKT|nr:hypothetical protein RF11_03515 [Thelohanellus kitauei]